MTHPEYTGEEVSRIGHEMYEKQIRPQVETKENIGKIISIDIKCGDYEIDADLLKSAERLRARRPDAVLWGERIGYKTAFAIGGSLERTKR